VVSGFVGGFTAADASAVANLSLAETAEVLTELVAKSLLSIEGNGPNSVYRRLDTTREYCTGKLVAKGEDADVHGR
ncbi:hypothetical protein, partial [Rhizobium leguminosarum]|uniref:hypothetical protein n=1 Tax=Rhizobium leguminosarum TaxID=384 RepID=UPI003F9C3627